MKSSQRSVFCARWGCVLGVSAKSGARSDLAAAGAPDALSPQDWGGPVLLFPHPGSFSNAIITLRQWRIVLSLCVLKPAEPCPAPNSQRGGAPRKRTPNRPLIRSRACKIWVGLRRPDKLEGAIIWRNDGGKKG